MLCSLHKIAVFYWYIQKCCDVNKLKNVLKSESSEIKLNARIKLSPDKTSSAE